MAGKKAVHTRNQYGCIPHGWIEPKPCKNEMVSWTCMFYAVTDPDVCPS